MTTSRAVYEPVFRCCEFLPAAPVAWPGWRPPGAPCSCEMNAGAASPWDYLSPYGCMRMVAELLLGHQTLWMLPRSISGVLVDSSGLCGPPWVKKWGHGGVWVFGPHTPRTLYGEGGSYIGMGTVTCDHNMGSLIHFLM